MRVLVRHFAMLREQRGVEEEWVEFEDATVVSALYEQLFPPGPEGALPVMFAVNQVYVQADQPLVDGDEVAFIPPLGGG